MLMIADVVHIS